MSELFWRMMKSAAYRSADIVNFIMPKRMTLKLYCYLTYLFRGITWRFACRYFGPEMSEYRGDIVRFVLSNINNGDHVLDAGCAEGNLTRAMASKAGKIVGIDIDRDYLNRIDKTDERLKNATFIAGDILDIKFNETFDVAVLVHAIEHLEDSAAVLRKLSGLAKKIIVETPDEEADWLTKLLRDLGIEERGDDKHVKLYDDLSLKAELEENGWKDAVSFKGFGIVRAVANSRVLKG